MTTAESEVKKRMNVNDIPECELTTKDCKTEIQKNQEIKDMLREQIKSLAEWNKKSFYSEPEQCRKNLETMVLCAEKLSLIHW